MVNVTTCANLIYTTVIKHDHSYINIHQVPKKMLKARAKPGKAHGTWGMLLHKKTIFDRYYCIHYIHYCIQSTKFARKFTKKYGTLFCHHFTISMWLDIFMITPLPGQSKYPYMLIKATYRSTFKIFSGLKLMY